MHTTPVILTGVVCHKELCEAQQGLDLDWSHPKMRPELSDAPLIEPMQARVKWDQGKTWNRSGGARLRTASRLNRPRRLP